MDDFDVAPQWSEILHILCSITIDLCIGHPKSHTLWFKGIHNFLDPNSLYQSRMLHLAVIYTYQQYVLEPGIVAATGAK